MDVLQAHHRAVLSVVDGAEGEVGVLVIPDRVQLAHRVQICGGLEVESSLVARVCLLGLGNLDVSELVFGLRVAED